jgi:hypothetical protein
MRVLMTLVLSLILAGCAAERGDGAGSATTQEEPTANGTEETTVYKEGSLPTVLDIPEPPGSTLSHGGREATGTVGSYCWTSGPSGDSSGCSDAFWPLIPGKHKTLTVSPNSELVFRYGGQNLAWWPNHPPKTVKAGAYPLKKHQKAPMIRPNHSLKAQGSGPQRTIPAKLPPGEYVVEVSVKEQQYDASYYFRVMVK